MGRDRCVTFRQGGPGSEFPRVNERKTFVYIKWGC